MKHSSQPAGGLRAGTQSSSKILAPQQADRDLIICNAYASAEPLDVYHVQGHRQVTNSSPIQYKECRDLAFPLLEGQQLEFRLQNLTVGTFYASGLPSPDLGLLLVPFRRHAKSMSVSFEFHALAASANSPQVVVIDAYHGKKKHYLKIVNPLDKTPHAALTQMSEEFHVNEVVTINPGNYKVVLEDSLHKNKTEKLISMTNASHCVVMRVGMESDGAEHAKREFPAELVVFSETVDKSRSAAFPLHSAPYLAMVLAAMYSVL